MFATRLLRSKLTHAVALSVLAVALSPQAATAQAKAKAGGLAGGIAQGGQAMKAPNANPLQNQFPNLGGGNGGAVTNNELRMILRFLEQILGQGGNQAACKIGGKGKGGGPGMGQGGPGQGKGGPGMGKGGGPGQGKGGPHAAGGVGGKGGKGKGPMGGGGKGKGNK